MFYGLVKSNFEFEFYLNAHLKLLSPIIRYMLAIVFV